MKILFVIGGFSRGGAERVATLLTRAWATSHTVRVIVFDMRGAVFTPGGEVDDLGLPTPRYPIGKAFVSLHRVLGIHREIRRFRPDRVISFMEGANFPTILACGFEGMRSRLTVSLRTNPERLDWLHRLLITVLYRHAGRVVTVSQAAALSLQRSFCLPSRQCANIPNPLDLAEIRTRMAAALPTGVLLPRGPFLLAVGRLIPLKRFGALIDIFARLAGGWSGSLVIVGEGPERERLTARIRELGLEGRVLLPGDTDNPYAWMARACALVLCSDHEGWPNVLIEAMACGCPVVAVDCPTGPREIIDHGRTGLLVPANDDGQLHDAIRRVLDDAALAAVLKRNALEQVERWSIERIAPRWLDQSD